MYEGSFAGSSYAGSGALYEGAPYRLSSDGPYDPETLLQFNVRLTNCQPC